MYRRSTARERLENYLREVAARRPTTRDYFDALVERLDPFKLGPAASRAPASIGAVLTDLTDEENLIEVLLGPPPHPGEARHWPKLSADARSRPRGWVRRAVNVVAGEIVLGHPRWPKIEADVRAFQRLHRKVAKVMDS
jgi:hypothetical protein